MLKFLRVRARESERHRRTERSVEGGLCCALEAHCVYRRVCVRGCLHTHTHDRELCMQARVTGAHTHTQRSVRFGIQNRIKTVLPRHHLCLFPGIFLSSPPFSCTHRHTYTHTHRNPHHTHKLSS